VIYDSFASVGTADNGRVPICDVNWAVIVLLTKWNLT